MLEGRAPARPVGREPNPPAFARLRMTDRGGAPLGSVFKPKPRNPPGGRGRTRHVHHEWNFANGEILLQQLRLIASAGGLRGPADRGLGMVCDQQAPKTTCGGDQPERQP